MTEPDTDTDLIAAPTPIDTSPAAMDELLAGEPHRIVERQGVRYVLLGTAHVSPRSVAVVEKAVAAGDWAAIAVELCPARMAAMDDREGWRKLDLLAVLRAGKGGLLAAQLALGAYQRQLAKQFGIEPGAELRAAVDGARAADRPAWLIDRDVGVTFRRVYRGLGFWARLRLVSDLLSGLIFSDEDLDEQAVEKLKESDVLSAAFRDLAAQSPALYERLIAERDRYMAFNLLQHGKSVPGGAVLAVVGAGHLDGLAEALKNQPIEQDLVAERQALERVPPASWFARHWASLLTVAILIGFAIGFARSPELGWNLILTWVIFTGGLAGLGALIARGHPLTALSGVLAAPFTTLNPIIAAGMVTAVVELSLRRPQIADLESLRDDLSSWAGWRNNGAARVLLVFMLTNLGAASGKFIAGFRIFQSLV